MEKIAILAITKNGIKIAKELKEKFSSWEVFVPNKFSDGNTIINWYNNNTSTSSIVY
jgi:cobalt-precorrin 5A hydrolase